MTSDPIWHDLREEARRQGDDEPLLSAFLHASVLEHRTLESALARVLSVQLDSHAIGTAVLCELAAEAFAADPTIGQAVRADLACRKQRDPACTDYLTAFLHLKGFHALESYRVAHWLWRRGRRALAMLLQSRISAALAVDIHPAARIGKAVMFDHATGIVIGETAEVADNVSILHGVTLGGTGKEAGERHPKVRDGVMIGAGAKLLGNIVVGRGAKVGAGSVVLANVPPHCTVAGVPAVVIGQPKTDQPALEMDQSLSNEDDAVDSGDNS